MTSEIHWQNRNTTKDGTKLITPNKRGLDFDNINEYAKKFRFPGERIAFIEGAQLGFNLATKRDVEYLSEFEKLVYEMRSAQINYFRTRSKEALHQSKQLEKRVDKYLIDKKSDQLTLL